MRELDQKALNEFSGRVVRKDLVQDLKSGVNVPTYVLEYLLGQYCATDDEEALEEGVETVKKILKKHYVRPDEAEKVKSKTRRKGRYRIIDKMKVKLNEKRDTYFASFVNLGISKVHVEEDLVSEHMKLLGGGVWAIIDLEYVSENAGSDISIFEIDSFKPIQISHLDLSELKEKRSKFSRDEWLDLILQSIGFEPKYFSKREKFLFISRVLPLCETNYNLVELGPRGTGKSYVYREISPYSILVSGGKTSAAKLFLNLNTKQVGLVGMWDTVAFDEVGGLKFQDPEVIQILKDYMESGSFSRGTEEISAHASMTYIGNIDQDVESILKKSHLFKPFPDEMQDLALIDRYHYYLPGWEIPKMQSKFFSDQYGFIVDYLSEFLRKIRKENYNDIINQYFSFGDHLNHRDVKAVRKTVSALVKLLHPDGEFSKEQLEEYLRFAMGGRRRVKEQLKKMGGMEYRAVNFSYIDQETHEEKFVTIGEQTEETFIPQDTQNSGTVFTIGKDGSKKHLFRIETQALPGKGKKKISGAIGKEMKDPFETAYDYLRANIHEITADETLEDYDIKSQVVNPSDADKGDETEVAFLVSVISSIMERPIRSELVILGSMTIIGEVDPVGSLPDLLQLAADSGAKKVLIPAANKKDFQKIPDEILNEIELIFYSNPTEAATKAMNI